MQQDIYLNPSGLVPMPSIKSWFMLLNAAD